MRKIKRVLILIMTLLAINACVPAPAVATPTVFSPIDTKQPAASTVAEMTITTPADAGASCTDSGRIKRYRIASSLLNDDQYFSVYFPPCYSESTDEGYPVLYALHGQNFTDEMWIDLGAVELANALILREEIKPFLIVMPFEEFFFRGSENNNFPDMLIEEIIPWIENTLNVCEEKACRAIGGISRGASWAMRIGLAEWKTFGAIGAHSTPTFKDDLNNLPDWLKDIPYDKEPRIYMDIGRFDPEVKSAYRFEQILNEKGIPHDWHLNNGRHTESYWMEHMESYLRWYSEGWE